MGKRKDSAEPTGNARQKTISIPSLLQILVECKSEAQQQELFERLRAEGFKCRVLTL